MATFVPSVLIIFSGSAINNGIITPIPVKTMKAIYEKIRRQSNVKR